MPEVRVPVVDENFIAIQELDVRTDKVLEHCIIIDTYDAKRSHSIYDAWRIENVANGRCTSLICTK
jgi:hypothetical protein